VDRERIRCAGLWWIGKGFGVLVSRNKKNPVRI